MFRRLMEEAFLHAPKKDARTYRHEQRRRQETTNQVAFRWNVGAICLSALCYDTGYRVLKGMYVQAL